MKITLITATFNSYPNLLDTINSIQQQTHPSFEWIVIDGGSTDQTQKLINNTTLISQIISEPDQGIYDALNKGIQRASGDIVGFLHSDDLLATPNILAQIGQVFDQTQVDGIYGDLEYVDKQDTNKVIRYWKSKPFKRSDLKYGWMPAHPTLFLKREVYEKHGLFDLDFKISADYDFMLRILKDRELRFAYLPQVVTKMRVGGTSNKNIQNIIQKSKEDLRAIRKNKLGGWYTLLLKNVRKINQFTLTCFRPSFLCSF